MATVTATATATATAATTAILVQLRLSILLLLLPLCSSCMFTPLATSSFQSIGTPGGIIPQGAENVPSGWSRSRSVRSVVCVSK